MSDDKRENSPPYAVKVINAVAHGVMSVLVWVLAWDAQAHRGMEPEVVYSSAAVLTGLGGLQLKKGQPPISALVSGSTAALQALRHMKSAAVLAVVTGSLLVSGCGLFDDPGETAKDVVEHPVFRGTLGGLLGACAATQGAHPTWDTVCDAAQQVDAVQGLLQGGAGPAELPPDVASRECVAYESGEVRCE